MSNFDEFFSLEDEKKKKKTSPPTPRAQRPPRAQKTAQIDLEKISNTISQVLDEKLQKLTRTLENQAISQIAEPSKIVQVGIIHNFTRENLIQFIGRRWKRGTKLCELRDFFYPTPVGEIDKEVQKLRKEGIIQKNRSGWMSLRKKNNP